MLSLNTTPFAAIGFEQWHRDGGSFACIAARAELVFKDDGTIDFADEQEVVLADEFSGDPQKTPLIKPNDLVPFKPVTDITFLGSAFALRGEAAPKLHGAIRIGDLKATIRASGPRNWIPEKDTWVLLEPEAVTDVPLCYTKASGGWLIGDPDGTVDPRNPIGPNLISPTFTPKGMEFPAPQIDSSENEIHTDFTSPPLPQGFGPVSPWWQSRQRFAGTYDKEWEDNVHPRLPKDFDYRFYNCAHPNLAYPGFLQGGEFVELTNLTASQYLKFRLPNVVPFAKFSYTDGREISVRLNLDGVHMDFREEPYRYSLTWRAWAEMCPSLFKVDLDTVNLEVANNMELLKSVETGVSL